MERKIMPQSLLARAQKLVKSKPGALALTILPIATIAGRPTCVQASVLFSFSSAGVTGSQDLPPFAPPNHLADESISATNLLNGGIHITGTVGTLTYSATYAGTFEVHAEGFLAGTINSGQALMAQAIL